MAEEVKTEDVQAHETSISMSQAVPDELDAGVDIALRIKVSCPSACDLRGKIVKIIAQDAVVAEEIYLTQFYDINETDTLIVKAPTKPGEYTWTAVFPVQDKQGILHQESSVPFSFIVKPHHATSMAVWDVASPVVCDAKFKLKVGVRCSADCKLTDKPIEIYDHEGGKVATEKLGDVPWPGTNTLYWAEVELEAPGTEGYYRWTVKFPEPDLEFPHEEASCTFGFATAKPPEHVVTVEVIDADEKTPIKNAHVLLHPYRSYTDENGVAKVEVPKGNYQLYVSKDKYETFQTTVEVANNVAIKAELLVAPVRDDSG